jgi:hypothetical protein
MSHVMIRCPHTGRAVATGVETDNSTFDRIPDVLMHVQCPLCGLEHSWWKREAWLQDQAVQECSISAA